MKSFSAIFFLVLFGIAANVQSSYYYFWKLNQQKITREFCENIDKPVLKCNGKCHLAKKLMLEQDNPDLTKNQTRESSELRIPLVEYVFATQRLLIALENTEVGDRSVDRFPYRNLAIHSGYLNDCLRPPSIV